MFVKITLIAQHSTLILLWAECLRNYIQVIPVCQMLSSWSNEEFKIVLFKRTEESFRHCNLKVKYLEYPSTYEKLNSP